MPTSWINAINEFSDPKPKVLSVGTLPELLASRHAILEGAGYKVFTTSKPEQAMLKIENGDCGVLLLCYSLDEEKRISVVSRFREKCENGRVVAITNQPMKYPGEADVFVYGVEGAEALIAAVGGQPTG